MAEDKNGFLLYKDLIKTVQKLPKDKAGELFMHILKYVNDENPETDDLLIEVAFEPVKQKLKRDLKKYEETKEKNRENANKRWQKTNATALDSKQKDATVCDRIPDDTKHADSDNDSDTGNGTDSDNDFLLKKETKEENITKEILQENSKRLNTGNKPSKKVAPKKVSENDHLEMPEDFLPIWEEWHQYRKAKRIKAYAGTKWEQIAVDKLLELSNRDPVTAKLILKQTYESNYQGFFPLKPNFNGQSNNNNSNSRFTKTTTAGSHTISGKTSATTAIARHLAKITAGNSESGDLTTDAEIV